MLHIAGIAAGEGRLGAVEGSNGDGVGSTHAGGERSRSGAEHVDRGVAGREHRRRRDGVDRRGDGPLDATRGEHALPPAAGRSETGDGEELVGVGRDAETVDGVIEVRLIHLLGVEIEEFAEEVVDLGFTGVDGRGGFGGERALVGVEIDLLFCAIPRSSVPSNLDISCPSILRGVNDRMVRSLNGPRDTERPKLLMPHWENFKTVLRAARLWGKRRGIFSNKTGYLGGINCAILAGFACQQYPKKAPARLVQRFLSPARRCLPPPRMCGDLLLAGRSAERGAASTHLRTKS